MSFILIVTQLVNAKLVFHPKVAECGESFEIRRNDRPRCGRPRFTMERNIVKWRHQALHKLKKQRAKKSRGNWQHTL